MAADAPDQQKRSSIVRIEDVGVIGLGATGSTSARRLLGNGFRVAVHDRDAWAVVDLVEAGARPARLPADAAEPAQLVLVHVPDEAAAEEVLFDCGGVGETLPDGGFVVLAAPAGPEFVRSAADRLGALGLHAVEAWSCPDPGGSGPTLFVGGSPEHVAALAPALTAVAGTVLHVGPLGSVAALRAAVASLAGLRQPAPGRVDAPGTGVATLARAVAGGLVDAGAARRLHVPTAGVPGPRNGHVRSSVLPAAYPGALTLDELRDVVDGVRRRDGDRPPASGADTDGSTPLGLPSAQLEDVVTELERRCGVPLLLEARRTSTFGELVALVNSQVTSGV